MMMRKAIKNWRGRWYGYNSCPNCGDSFSWKLRGNLAHYETPSGIRQKWDGRLAITAGFSTDVSICSECLTNPKSLDINRIANNLKTLGWPESEIREARLALTQHKTAQS